MRKEETEEEEMDVEEMEEEMKTDKIIMKKTKKETNKC